MKFSFERNAQKMKGYKNNPFLRAVVLFFILILLLDLPVQVNALSYSLNYDANGNLVKDDSLVYEYNSLNQLIKVKDLSNKLIEEYFYDDAGQRIKKVEYLSGGKRTTYYLDEDFVKVIEPNGTQVDTRYYYANGQLVGEVSGIKKTFYHSNNLGSTNLKTDSQGNALSTLEYEPYGKELTTSESRFTYTGQEKDKTGLMYYGARYYDSEMTRFIQPDSLLPDVYDPQQLNRYAYARGNPIKYTDPSGHIIDTLFDIGSFGYDLYTVATDPGDWTNWAALGADGVCMLIPVVAGGGMAVRAAAAGGKVIDKVADAGKLADKVIDLGKSADKVADAGKITKVPDNMKTVYSVFPDGKTVPTEVLDGTHNAKFTRIDSPGKPGELTQVRVEAHDAGTINGRGLITEPLHVQKTSLHWNPQDSLTIAQDMGKTQTNTVRTWASSFDSTNSFFSDVDNSIRQGGEWQMDLTIRK